MPDCWHFGPKTAFRWTPCGASQIFPQPPNPVYRVRRSAEMRIAVVGTGGVGGYFGARLAARGNPVTFVARGQHLEATPLNGPTPPNFRGRLPLDNVHAARQYREDCHLHAV